MYFPLFVRVLCLSLFCYELLCVHSSFEIILKRKRKLVALLLLPYRCIVALNVLWLFLTVPSVGMQYVIVVFPDHTRLLFSSKQMTNETFKRLVNRYDLDQRANYYQCDQILFNTMEAQCSKL